MKSKRKGTEDGKQPHSLDKRLSQLERRCSSEVITSLIDVLLTVDKRLAELEQQTGEPAVNQP